MDFADRVRLFFDWFDGLPRFEPPKLRVPSGTKKAMLVAISDYPGHGHDLAGPKHDLPAVKRLYESNGWECVCLSDSEATRANVVALLEACVEACRPGDRLTLYYSGHGCQMEADADEASGRDQALYLYDQPLVDDDIAEVLSKLDPGASFMAVLDSCFSGSCIRGDAVARSVGTVEGPARARVLEPHPDIEARECLLSGCKDTEYSYDGRFGGVPGGAFTHWFVRFLSTEPSLTVGQFREAIKTCLPSGDYPQSPQCVCLPDMDDKPIL